MHGYRREIVLRSWSRWLLLNQLLPCSHFCHYILVLLLCTMNFTLQFYAGTSSYWKHSCLLNARDTIIHCVLIKLSLVSSFVTLPLTKHLPSDRSVQATAYTYSVNWCNLSNRLDGQFAGYTQHSTTTTVLILGNKPPIHYWIINGWNQILMGAFYGSEMQRAGRVILRDAEANCRRHQHINFSFDPSNLKYKL